MGNEATLEERCLWQSSIAQSSSVVAFYPPAYDRPQIARCGDWLWLSCVSEGQVYCLSAQNGQVERVFDGCAGIIGCPLCADDATCVVGLQSLYCFDGEQRRLRWTASYPQWGDANCFHEHVEISQGSIIAGTHVGELRMFSLSTGEVEATMHCDAECLFGLAATGRRVFVGLRGRSGETRVAELGLAEGVVRWSCKLPIDWISGITQCGEWCVAWGGADLAWVDASSGQLGGVVRTKQETVETVTHDGTGAVFFAHVGAQGSSAGIRRLDLEGSSVEDIVTTSHCLGLHYSPETHYLYECRIDGLRIIDPERRAVTFSLLGARAFRAVSIPLVCPPNIYALTSEGAVYAFRHP